MDRKAYNRAYYLKHKDFLLERANRYIDNNREKVYEYNKIYAKTHPKKSKKGTFKIEQNVSIHLFEFNPL